MNDHREIPVRATSTGLHSYSNSINPYVHVTPLPTSSAASNRPNPMDTISDAFNRCSKSFEKATRQAGVMADNFWNHPTRSQKLVRVSASVADAATARLFEGTKELVYGHDKLFQQTFGIIPGEKLLKSYACYISTPSGPMIGTLYISTKRLAFCSDYPFYHYPYSLQNHSMYYKVIVLMDQLSTVNPSANRLNPSEKYIQVVTVDGYEFIFMGFIAYDKALKTLNETLQHYRNHSSGN